MDGPGPSARLLTECAALLGYRFDARVLAACCRMTIGQAATILRRGCSSGLFVCESAQERRYRFRHALYRSAIRETLQPAVVQALHARIASSLERFPVSQIGVEVLAYHWECAGDAARACRYRELAAAEARELGSSE